MFAWEIMTDLPPQSCKGFLSQLLALYFAFDAPLWASLAPSIADWHFHRSGRSATQQI